MIPFKAHIMNAADDVAQYVSMHAQQIAGETKESLAATHAALIVAVRKELHEQKPSAADGRTALWRVRVQLTPNTSSRQVAWDSDPELPLSDHDDQAVPGTRLFRGLKDVAFYVACCAQEFHAGRDIEGLGEETLLHSLKALRVSLSRLDGNAWWRPHYTLMPTESVVVQPIAGSLKGLSGGTRSREAWRALVHVVREDEA